jgi:hypothetical protein
MNDVSGLEVGSVHSAHGLRVRSEVRLLGLPELATDQVDVDVRWDPPGSVPVSTPPGEVLLRFEGRDALRYAATREGDVYRLRFARCCEFTVAHDLQTVRCRPDPSADPALSHVLAEGGLMAFLLAMMQCCVLHASAVEVDDGAVAVVGGSGFGKSTVAALLCVGGCPLVTDDVLRIDLSDGVEVFSGAQELRLRPAARHIAEQFSTPVRTRDTADGRLALRPRATRRRRLPLRAMVIPRPHRDRDRLRVERLPLVHAMSHLLAVPRLLGWQSPLALRQQFGMLAELVQRVPVYEAQVPWGPPFDPRLGPDLVEAISRDLVVATVVRGERDAATGSRRPSQVPM